MNPQAFYKLSYGVYIVCSKKESKANGQIANTVFQVAAEPATVAISINKSNLTHEFILASKVFTVSVLARDASLRLIGDFGFKSGRELDKLALVKIKGGVTGAPVVLEDAVAYLEAEVVGQQDAGTHTVFIGKVVAAEVLKPAEPMTYAYYHEVKRGASPKTAPTYIKEETKEMGGMQKYICKVCGYVYEPEKGDPDSGIKPGTAFADLPADWICPICGAGKDQFEAVKE